MGGRFLSINLLCCEDFLMLHPLSLIIFARRLIGAECHELCGFIIDSKVLLIAQNNSIHAGQLERSDGVGVWRPQGKIYVSLFVFLLQFYHRALKDFWPKFPTHFHLSCLGRFSLRLINYQNKKKGELRKRNERTVRNKVKIRMPHQKWLTFIIGSFTLVWLDWCDRPVRLVGNQSDDLIDRFCPFVDDSTRRA